MTLPARRRAAGFSLIELLAAAAIVGIMAAVAVPVVKTTMQRQKEHDLRLALRDIRRGIDAYKAAVQARHIDARPEDSGYPATLGDLVNGMEDALNKTGPRLYFLRRIPRDPFFPNTAIPAADTWGLRSFDSPPTQPRAGKDVFDVYSTASGAGLNGVPYAEW